jgi:hypothetical protein
MDIKHLNLAKNGLADRQGEDAKVSLVAHVIHPQSARLYHACSIRPEPNAVVIPQGFTGQSLVTKSRSADPARELLFVIQCTRGPETPGRCRQRVMRTGLDSDRGQAFAPRIWATVARPGGALRMASLGMLPPRQYLGRPPKREPARLVLALWETWDVASPPQGVMACLTR